MTAEEWQAANPGKPLPYQRIVHGTPITPTHLLNQLAGGSFCVSFAAPSQLHRCMKLLSPESMLLLDNGAYTYWRKGHGQVDREKYREDYWDWANDAQDDCDIAVSVIPDVIGGSEEENWLEASYAIRYELCLHPERAMFVWHMDEELDGLMRAARLFNFVAIGSCAEYDVQRHPKRYLQRLREAYLVFEYVHAVYERLPFVHLMRGTGVLHKVPWVQSADSSNIARNHHRTRGQERHVAAMDARILKKVRERKMWIREQARVSNFIYPDEDPKLPAQMTLQSALFPDSALTGLFTRLRAGDATPAL